MEAGGWRESKSNKKIHPCSESGSLARGQGGHQGIRAREPASEAGVGPGEELGRVGEEQF